MDGHPDRINFLIVSSGYNCEGYVRKMYNSLLSQTYRNFTAVLIDDGSTELATKESLQALAGGDERIRVFISDSNMGAAYRRHQAIKTLATGANRETVVVLLGMDDELLPNALETIEKEYRKGAWMTYGNWVANDGYKLPDGFLDFPAEVHENRDYRKVTYRSTGLNTFKKFLFDQLTDADFRFNGEWVKATTESNLMISFLEMCGKERIGIVYEPIVIYNRRTDNTVNRMGREYQNAIYKDVMSRKKKPLFKND